jgi:hypothetical protein
MRPKHGADQQTLLRRLIALDIDYRFRAGQKPQPEDYLEPFVLAKLRLGLGRCAV